MRLQMLRTRHDLELNRRCHSTGQSFRKLDFESATLDTRSFGVQFCHLVQTWVCATELNFYGRASAGAYETLQAMLRPTVNTASAPAQSIFLQL